MDVREQIAMRIKQLRKENSMTQKDLSNLTGLSLSTIIGYENKKREPNSKAMAELEKAFNVSGAYLRGETDQRTSTMIWDDDEILDSINNEVPQMMKRILALFEQESADNQHAIFTILSELQSILKSKDHEGKSKVLNLAMLNIKTFNDTLKINKTHD